MSQNPLLSKFVSLYNRIEDMQANFNRSRLQEYTALCDKLNANAAKIIKGNHCPHHLEQDNDILVLVIDGKNYELQFNDIVMLLDDEEIQRLTNAQREKEKEKERKERREGQKMKNNNTAQDMNNPFSAMAQYLWAPFMSMAAAQGLNQIPIAEPKETSILEDLNAIQKKVILLEEKNKNSSELEDKISELSTELTSIKDQYSIISDEKGSLEEKLRIATEDSANYKQRMETAESDRAKLKNEVSSLNSKVAELRELSTPDSDELARLRDENASLKENLDATEKKMISLKKEVATLSDNSNVQELKDAVEKYKHLAFTDQQYGVKNANAYRDFIKNCEKDKVTVSVCGICNTRQINQLYGRSHGDTVIKIVADRLSEEFGVDNVYRVYGDQFYLFLINDNSTEIKRKLAAIQNSLLDDTISISFGVIDAVTCNDMAQAIKQAEGDMNGMKVKNGFKQIVSNRLNEMKKNEDKAKEGKKKSEPSPEPEVGAEAEVTEPESEESVEKIEDVEVLSSTTVQRMNEEEPIAEADVITSDSDDGLVIDDGDDDDDDDEALFDAV